jgi:hypothetical protein
VAAFELPAEGVLATEARGFLAGFEFLEDADDLGFAEPRFSHVVPFEAKASDSTYPRRHSGG